MDSALFYGLAADLLLFCHAMFVVFVVLALVFICLGKAFQWRWVRNPWFRLLHLLAIAVVALLSWIGASCPLTDLEMALRIRAGGPVYAQSFIGHWLEKILYYQAPVWVFTLCYTLFGALVIACWFWVRPGRLRRSHRPR